MMTWTEQIWSRYYIIEFTCNQQQQPKKHNQNPKIWTIITWVEQNINFFALTKHKQPKKYNPINLDYNNFATEKSRIEIANS